MNWSYPKVSVTSSSAVRAIRSPPTRYPAITTTTWRTSLDALEGSEESEDGILRVKHEYIDPMFWSDYTDPESQTKKTKEQIAREKAGRLARVKRILAASTRQDWEADGPRLWVRKGDSS